MWLNKILKKNNTIYSRKCRNTYKRLWSLEEILSYSNKMLKIQDFFDPNTSNIGSPSISKKSFLPKFHFK